MPHTTGQQNYLQQMRTQLLGTTNLDALNERFHGRPVGRPRLRWEGNISRDSWLLLNVREQASLVGAGLLGGGL
jgi:hypothetical protein